MPAHIYARVGDHAASAHCNELAAAADRKFLAATGQEGVYPMMYYSHNLHFLAYAACMRGDFNEAKDAAAKLVANVAPHVKMMADLEGFMPTGTMVLLAFERWDDILKSPAPDAHDVEHHRNLAFCARHCSGQPGKDRGSRTRAGNLFAKRPPGSQRTRPTTC